MEYSFASYQIAEMAVEVEQEGFKFYQKLANSSTEQAVKELFLSLAQDEKMHESVFADMARDAKVTKKVFGYSINVVELLKTGMDAFKESMANSAPVDQQIDMHRALELAINNEVLSVRVYTKMVHAYSNQFFNVFNKIIAQENSHLQKLQDLKKKLGL